MWMAEDGAFTPCALDCVHRLWGVECDDMTDSIIHGHPIDLGKREHRQRCMLTGRSSPPQWRVAPRVTRRVAPSFYSDLTLPPPLATSAARQVGATTFLSPSAHPKTHDAHESLVALVLGTAGHRVLELRGAVLGDVVEEGEVFVACPAAGLGAGAGGGGGGLVVRAGGGHRRGTG